MERRVSAIATLFGAKGSGSAAIEAALTLAGVPFRQVEGATWEPGAGFDALCQVNPLGQVPALQTADGQVLTESAAILIALGLAHPESGLLPADPALQAQSVRGLVYIAANCYAMIGIIDYPERVCADCDEALALRLRDGARARLHDLWSTFANGFVPAPWLGGATLGALDLLAAVVSRWSGARAHLAQHRPALLAHLQRVDADPRVAPVFQRHWPVP